MKKPITSTWLREFAFIIASQDDSVEEAKANLTEAIELFLETADESGINNRLPTEIYITQLEVAVG